MYSSSSAVLAVMFNTGQKVTERSQVANAADAAAYSGAVWTARHLNFIAYTNRAMIANHVAVGHFVSYVSWVRYINDSIEAIDRVTQWIPYVGQYVDLASRSPRKLRDATEEAAQSRSPAIDAWNANIRAAQAEAQASLAFRNLQEPDVSDGAHVRRAHPHQRRRRALEHAGRNCARCSNRS